MHGFPDASRIYNQLIGPLAPQWVVTFDWMGYGRSSRRDSAKFAAIDRQREILAVLDDLGLDQVVLVAHDAAGPGSDRLRRDLERVARLVLLNTYYGRSLNLRLPEMIAMMADPALAPLTDALLDDPDHRLWLLAYTARRLGLDDSLPPTASGSIRSFRNFSETPASPMRWPKSERGTAAIPQALDRHDSTPRPADADHHRAGVDHLRRNDPNLNLMWHSTSAACSRTQNCTWSSRPPTGPGGINLTWSQI